MDKTTQTKYIVQPSTIISYYSPRHTLRTASVASQQLVQVPRSPEPACQVPARKHAQDEHSEAQTAPARHATIADRSTRTTALICTRAGLPQPTPARNHAHASPDPPRHPRGKSTTEEGVVGHRAAYGRLPALLQPTKGIPRLPETIQTSGSRQEDGNRCCWLAPAGPPSPAGSPGPPSSCSAT